MRKALFFISIVLFLTPYTAWSGSLTVPNEFQGGQKALASEVNENFAEIEVQVTGNANDIAGNAASISANTGSINGIKGDLGNKADAQHIHDSGDLLDGGIHNIHITGRAAIAGTAETLDGLDSSDFAESLHNHVPGAIINQGDGGGLDADFLDGRNSDYFATSFHVHSKVLIREGYRSGEIKNLVNNSQYYWATQMPPEFLDGGILAVEVVFFENSPVGPGTVVLSLGYEGLNQGDTYIIPPTISAMTNSEQAFVLSGDATRVIHKATWSTSIADSDFLHIGILRGSQGSLTDDFGSEISILGFQVTYTN